MDYFNKFTKYAFRLELLQKYDVDEEKESLNEFLKTGKVLENKSNRDWANIIKNSLKRGAKMERVHIIKTPLSDYLKYEIEAYKLNIKAGEKISFVLKGDFDKVNKRIINQDFWLFDDKIVLTMNYNSHGKFKGFTELTKNINKFIKFKNELLLKSKPIEELKE